MVAVAFTFKKVTTRIGIAVHPGNRSSSRFDLSDFYTSRGTKFCATLSVGRHGVAEQQIVNFNKAISIPFYDFRSRSPSGGREDLSYVQ